MAAVQSAARMNGARISAMSILQTSPISRNGSHSSAASTSVPEWSRPRTTPECPWRASSMGPAWSEAKGTAGGTRKSSLRVGSRDTISGPTRWARTISPVSPEAPVLQVPLPLV